jgi:hypothetical protein
LSSVELRGALGMSHEAVCSSEETHEYRVDVCDALTFYNAHGRKRLEMPERGRALECFESLLENEAPP